MPTATYSTKFAAERARKKMADAETLESVKQPNGKFAIVIRSASADKPAKAKVTRDLDMPPRRKAAKAAKAPKAARASAPAGKALGKRAKALADAQAGRLPKAPDFSAPTHTRFRAKLGEIKQLVAAGDVKALKAVEINPISTSPKALARYRDLAVAALTAQAGA